MSKKTAVIILCFVLFLSSIPVIAFGTVYSNGDRNVHSIAVTIDDWWHPEELPQYLELAEKYNVKFTFFPVGGMFKEENADNWLNVINAGHEIGNHSVSHKPFTQLTEKQLIREMNGAQKYLDKILGEGFYSMNLIRLPGGTGTQSKDIRLCLHYQGWDNIIYWDVKGESSEEIISQTQNGSIILLHANEKDYNILCEILPVFKELGYNMTTVSELLNIESRSNK